MNSLKGTFRIRQTLLSFYFIGKGKRLKVYYQYLYLREDESFLIIGKCNKETDCGGISTRMVSISYELSMFIRIFVWMELGYYKYLIL